MQSRNLILFLVLSLFILFGWAQLRRAIWPPKPEDEQQAKKEADKEKEKPREQEKEKVQWGEPRIPPERTALDEKLRVGDGENYFLHVFFDRRGAGVRKLVLKKFQAATPDGHPEWIKDTGEPLPLELIPDIANSRFASHLLYHYDYLSNADNPALLDTLGKAKWDVVKDDQGNPVSTSKLDDGRTQQRIEFRYVLKMKEKRGKDKEIEVAIELAKIYTLKEGDYHLGLDLKLKRVSTGGDEDRIPLKFRYQLTGAHGLPIEGKWWTGTFRNVLMAQISENGAVDRRLFDMHQMSTQSGGETEERKQGKRFRYAGVAIQYFSSVIVIPDDDAGKGPQDFIARARPTLELEVIKGRVKAVSPEKRQFILERPGEKDLLIYLDRNLGMPPEDVSVAVIAFSTDEGKVQWAQDIGAASQTQPLWEDDVTVRLTTDPFELKPGVEVTHHYMLYNGPVKPSLLGFMTGAAAVNEKLVDEYAHGLNLNTMVDYPSPTWLGAFGNAIYFTPLVIKATNLMHWILAKLHLLLPSYALCIVLLTVLVRGIMFPISRNQAKTSIKMQELAPELKKMQEKYKDDRQAMAQAQWALYQKHGINPFASCWLLLLQMPIYMGLYYAFQESIQFRLAPFWPTWIENLAAPDMMFRWGDRIPIISTPDSYGSILFLGPYFNLLPIVAVVFMLITQKMMTPPPTDEQQEMQMKMLKYMSIFFGLLFYKVAAGLCLYFIASSVWGIVERRLIPKKAPDKIQTADNLLQTALVGGPSTTAPASGAVAYTTVKSGGKKGRKKRQQERQQEARQRAVDGDKPRGWWQRLREWWAEVQRQAEKK
jgi:YidC/Oxa1 family membrane protein insertase